MEYYYEEECTPYDSDDWSSGGYTSGDGAWDSDYDRPQPIPWEADKKMSVSLLETRVTALLKVEDRIFAAVGGFVLVFERKGVKWVKIKRLNLRQRTAHQLKRVRKTLVMAICNTKDLFFFQLDPNKNDFNLEPLIKTSPDWIIDCYFPEGHTYVLSAHNRCYDWDQRIYNNYHPEEIVCEETCIIYAGKIISTSDQIVILAGTVFQEVLVWMPEKSKVNSVLHRLKGHEGVIFCVDFQPDLNLICSSSDDRTLRIWKVLFGEDQSWKTAEIQATNVLEGFHSARIFRCKFKDDFVIAAGEDSVLNVWKINAKESEVQLDHVLNRKGVHHGSPIWAVDMDQGEIVTGGGDGGINIFSLDSQQEIELIDIKSLVSEGDYPKTVDFHSDWKSVISVTNSGAVLSLGSNKKVLVQDEMFSRYAQIIVEKNRLIFGTLGGKFVIYNLIYDENSDIQCEKSKEIDLYEGKIFSLHSLQRSHYLTCGPKGVLKMIEIGDENETNVVSEMILPECGEQRWVSCAVLNGEKLIVGDRVGNVHAYNWVKESQPFVNAKKVHGRHGVGHVVFCDEDVLMTIGRDGFMKEIVLSQDSIREICQTKMPMETMERIVNVRDDRLILGFQSDQFVIYSQRLQKIVHQIHCGGGHRAWDFMILKDGSARFVFVKDKRIYETHFALRKFLNSDVNQPLHSKEICAIEHFEIGNKHYLVTGGEDVLLKVHLLAYKGQNVTRHLVKSLKSHISSIKCIKAMTIITDHEVILVSAGGRAQVIVWKVQLTPKKQEIIVTELASHMLKGSDKKRKKTWKDSEVIYDTELRFMDLVVMKFNGGIRIITAGSDGILRNFSFADNKINLVSESVSLKKCILKLAILKESEKENLILVGTTDGQVVEFDVSDDKGFEFRKGCHANSKSGINCIHVDPEINYYWAGDDAGEITQFTKDSQETINIPKCHTGQVSGLCRVGNEYIISASMDARVAIWEMHQICRRNHVPRADGDGWTLIPIFEKTRKVIGFLRMAAETCTDLSYIQAMAVWHRRPNEVTIAVAGDGLTLLKLIL